MALSKERKGEIAYAFVKAKLRERGIPHFKPNEILRQIGNTQKLQELQALGITEEEAIEFATNLLQELFGELVSGLEKKE